MNRIVHALALAAALIGAPACTGELDGSAGNGDGLPRTPDSGVPQVPENAVEPLRRLTHNEYRATLTDLFGFESETAKRLPSEGGQIGFANDVRTQLVTPPLTQLYAATSREMAARATEDLPTFLGCDPAAGDETACVATFAASFGRRAFRRPLTAEETDRLLAVYAELRETTDTRGAVEGIVSALIQSPKFLYRAELGGGGAHRGGDGTLSAYELASRTSYLLWGSMPDEDLFRAAEDGSILDADVLDAEVTRLAADPRATEASWRFISEWFDLDHVESLRPTQDVYEHYRVYLQGIALEESARAFVGYVFAEEGARLDALLTSPTSFVGTRIKTIYGVEPTGLAPKRFDTDPAQRSGLLTHPLWLATNSQPSHTDPIRRGRFVREQLLCEPLPALPVNVVPLPPEVSAAPTARERYTVHATDPACAGCHSLMDPIGFAFEHHDAIGRWRDTENGAAIDPSGSFMKASGEEITFTNARDLTEQLAADDSVADCAVRQWFRFAFGRPETEADDETLDELSAAFDAGDRSFHALLSATVRSRAFRSKSIAGGSP